MTAPAARVAGWRQALWPGIAALVAVMGVGRFVYTPILPEMLAAGALSLPQAGWVASANFAGYLAGAMAASRLGGRARPGALARGGLTATVLALAAMALVDGPAAWMAIRFAAGAASAFALVFVSAQVMERLAALGETDRAIWLYSGVGLGIAASAVTVQAVHAAGASWQWAWGASAVLAGVFAVLAWRGAGPGPGEAGGAAVSAGAATAGFAAPRAFAATVAAYGLFGLGYVIHATYLPAMVRAAGYSASAASWIWVLVGVSVIAGTAGWRAFARRYGTRAAIVACYAVEGATALAPMLAADSIVAAAIAAVGLGTTLPPVTGLALTHARGLDPGRGARAIATMTAAFGLGQIVGPVAAVALAARAPVGGNPFGLPSLLACAVLLVAAALMSRRWDARG